MMRRVQPPGKRRGFTLIEVLVAVIVLSIGVIVALLIFPRGFDTFTSTQNTHTALSLLDNWVAGFEEHPESLPDEIAPLLDGSSADIRQFYFADFNAVDYQSSDTATSWYAKHLYSAGSKYYWPLWQPLSARVLRRVRGERVMVPSEFSTVDLSGSAVNVAFLPKYFPRFGPLAKSAGGEAVQVYDLRYRKVSEEQLEALVERLGSLQDNLYYAVDYQRARLKLLPDDNARSLRIVFQYLTNADPPGIGEATARTFIIPASTDMTSLVDLQLSTLVSMPPDFVQFTPPQPDFYRHQLLTDHFCIIMPPDYAKLIPGGEQLNRAYQLDTSINPGEFDKIANLDSGYYYIDMSGDLLLGAVFFSRKDAGRTVKLDYTIADWNILHEDVTVSDDGYVVLSLPELKVRDTPAYPREPHTWGLYAPMRKTRLRGAWTSGTAYSVDTFVQPPVHDAVRYNGTTYTCTKSHTSSAATEPGKGTNWQDYWVQQAVIGLVDMRNGLAYNVVPDNPAARQPKYTIAPAKPIPLPTLATAVDLKLATRGRFRLGGESASDPDWNALRGQTFRVFYRVRRDWTMQVFKPPAQFWRADGAADLGWNKFSLAKSNVSVPGVYEGLSVAADYPYREELCRAAIDTTSDTVDVDSADVDDLRAELAEKQANGEPFLVRIVNPDADPDVFAEVVGVSPPPSPPQVTLKQAAIIKLGAVFIDPESPLLQASGEVHTVPQREEGTAASIFTLRHLPVDRSTIAVRGVSVMVRGMWVQPRSGSATVLKPGVKEQRTINERWQGKSASVILPTTRD